MTDSILERLRRFHQPKPLPRTSTQPGSLERRKCMCGLYWPCPTAEILGEPTKEDT